MSLLFNMMMANAKEQKRLKKWLASGDSTIDAYLRPSVPSLVFSPAEIAIGYQFETIAHTGDNVVAQVSKWDALNNKTLYDGVIIQLGLNEVYATGTQVIGYIQNLINKIKAEGKVDVKVLLAQMLPARTRLNDFPGAYAMWQQVNAAIAAEGFTNVDGFITAHLPILNDGNDDMKLIYYADYPNDKIHENEAGAQVIADAWYNSIIILENGT